MWGYFNNTKFKYSNLSIPNQAVILLSIIWIISLFSPWIIDQENWISWNSFNTIAGNIWYIMAIIYFVLIFIMISGTYKDKLKLYADFSFKNHFLVICSWLASFCFWIISASFVNWLSTMWQNIVHWKWLILSMTIWIFIIIFWFLIRKEYKKINSEIILEHLNQTREKTKEKDNMTLPI